MEELNKTLIKHYEKAITDFVLVSNKMLYGDSKNVKITLWDKIIIKYLKILENIGLAWEALLGKHYCEY